MGHGSHAGPQPGVGQMADQTQIVGSGGTGFVLTTPEAVVDTSTGNVTGSKGVQGSGPIGTINASSYAIYDQGQRVVFDGAGDNKVMGVLTPKGSGG